MASNEYDFGFSFSDENEALGLTQQQPTVSPDDLKALQDKLDALLDSKEKELEDAYSKAVEEQYKAKLKEVEGLILPLLYNLMKNPEKAYIKWENRTAVIQNQINKIIAITRS
jgi:dihydroxyacetone kinase-like predicted kinase